MSIESEYPQGLIRVKDQLIDPTRIEMVGIVHDKATGLKKTSKNLLKTNNFLFDVNFCRYVGNMDKCHLG